MDLFGVFHQEKKKTPEEEYQEYINSAAWKRIRKLKIDQVGGKCERCHISKWSVRLEVHHKNYKNFKHERLEDLEVLCPKCHGNADTERKKRVEDKREYSPLIMGFEKWMDNGNNPGWRSYRDDYLAGCWKTFLTAIGRNTGRTYNKKFYRPKRWK